MTQIGTLAGEWPTTTGQTTTDLLSSSFFKSLSKATDGCKVSEKIAFIND